MPYFDYGYFKYSNASLKKNNPKKERSNLSKKRGIIHRIKANQFGKEFPFGGINEKGVVIEIMRSNAEYPKPDERPALNELQWIQYQLDNSASLEDVIANDKNIRIRAVKQELHFLVCDLLTL